MKLPKPGLFLGNVNIIDTDFGPLKIDRNSPSKLPTKHRGSIRLASSRYCTYQDFEERKKKVLEEPLP